jgi:hypothetical protein
VADNLDTSSDDELEPLSTRDNVEDDGDSLEDGDDAKDDAAIIEHAKAFLEQAEESEQEVRRHALDDIEFSLGKQWPDNVMQDRERDGRPCLVINRLPQFIQQITNDQRQNRPSIRVHPVGDGADEANAKIIQGLIRHIEYNSNADVAYDTAFEFATRGGFGFYRIVTDFVSPDSFDQEIYIKRVRNNFSVYLDPSHQEPDGSDASKGMILEYLTKEEYKEKYPNSEMASMDWTTIGNQLPSWMREGATLVCEYFYKEQTETLVHLLNTGESVLEEDLPAKQQEAAAANIELSIVKTRKTKTVVVKWVKLNAVEVLEKTIWPGKYIPIIPVYGGEVYVNGKKHLEGIVRHSKDPQRMYNYWASAETEAIALAPRTPFIVAEGQVEDYEDQWKTANRRNHAYLPYKPVSISGQPVNPPQRQSFEPAVQAITSARSIAADDLKATTGIYDSALGAQSPDISGVALQRRAGQSQNSNFHFMDNLTRSLRHTGRIIVDLLPKIYDTPRAMRIIGEDGSSQSVMINQSHKDPSGKEVLYDLDVGTYDVTVDVGPSYASKRQEAAASMQSLAQSYPKVMDIAGDLFVKNMDWPGAQDIAERIKKTLPPGLADDPKKQQIPPQVQAQMQQMSQMIKTLSGQLNDTTKIIETKKLDLEHKERVELMKLQFSAEEKLAELGSKNAIALLNNEVQSIHKRLQYLDMNQPIDGNQNTNNFNPQQADGGNYAGLGHVGGSPTPTGGQSPGQPIGQ